MPKIEPNVFMMQCVNVIDNVRSYLFSNVRKFDEFQTVCKDLDS